MKQIAVIDRDYGWFSQEEVTVQRFEVEDGEKYLVWCNHAVTEVEDDTVELYRPDGPDIVHRVQYEVCQKCSAYREVNDNYETEWFDEPPK